MALPRGTVGRYIVSDLVVLGDFLCCLIANLFMLLLNLICSNRLFDTYRFCLCIEETHVITYKYNVTNPV